MFVWLCACVGDCVCCVCAVVWAFGWLCVCGVACDCMCVGQFVCARVFVCGSVCVVVWLCVVACVADCLCWLRVCSFVCLVV